MPNPILPGYEYIPDGEPRVFGTRNVNGHEADVDWTDKYLYAPDVVEKDGKYYLYFYILCAPGGVAVSDTPAGPFKLVSKYKIPDNLSPEKVDNGVFIDPGYLLMMALFTYTVVIQGRIWLN